MIKTIVLRAQVPLFAAAVALSSGCASREVVRDSQDPSIDAHAMSTSLDKDDIKRTLEKMLNDLRVAPVMDQWRAARGEMVVAIAPFINDTSEHIDSQLGWMLDVTEAWLARSGTVTVISRERQMQALEEVERSQHPAFDPRHIPQYGKMLNCKYYVTGKVKASDERGEDTRRVQYLVTMQVIDVETGAIKWTQQAELTKMIR
jgi:uncharacterized protein (TIGR02722 family)